MDGSQTTAPKLMVLNYVSRELEVTRSRKIAGRVVFVLWMIYLVVFAGCLLGGIVEGVQAYRAYLASSSVPMRSYYGTPPSPMMEMVERVEPWLVVIGIWFGPSLAGWWSWHYLRHGKAAVWASVITIVPAMLVCMLAATMFVAPVFMAFMDMGGSMWGLLFIVPLAGFVLVTLLLWDVIYLIRWLVFHPVEEMPKREFLEGIGQGKQK